MPKAQRILAIDTATGPGSVAVWADGRVAASIEDTERSMQSARLLPMAEKALLQAGLTYKDLTLVACTTGPGSFTGIRVGLAAARGIAFAAGVPGAGFTTLEVLAFAAKNKGKVLAALNAGKGEWYYQAFDGGKPLFAAKTGSEAQAMNDAPGAQLAGNVGGQTSAPSAAALAELAARDASDTRPIRPFYIRPPDALVPTKNL